MAENTELTVTVSMIDKLSSGVKTMEDKIKSMSANATKAGAAFTATGAVITGLAVKSVMDFSEMGDAIEKMSARTGLGAEAVSALRVAADASGTSIETVEAGIKKMELTMGAASDTSDGMKKAFDGIGMSVDDLFAEGTSPEIQFELFAAAIGSVTDPAAKTQLAVEAFGKAGADLIPMFEDGNFSMEQWKTQAGSMGVLMSDEVAGQAAELNDAMGYLTTTVNGLWLKVGTFLAPVFTDLAQKIQPIINKVTEWMAANPKLTQIIALMVLGLGALLTILGPILLAMAALPAIIAGVGVAIGIATGPIGLITLAIAGLVAAGVALYMNWDTIKNKAGEVFGTIGGIISGAFDTAKGAITGSINWIIYKINDFIRGYNGIASKIDAIPGVSLPSIGEIPALAKGGIVNKPTLALIGEAGPEAVVPLSRASGRGGFDAGGKKEWNVTINGAGQTAASILAGLNTMYKLS